MYKGQGTQCAARAAWALTDRRRACGQAVLSDVSQPEQLVAGSPLTAGEDARRNKYVPALWIVHQLARSTR